MRVTENDIRPEHIFDEYLRLCAEDTITYFKDADRMETNCPVCGTKGNHLFNKKGFDYDECPSCISIYVNPRPVKKSFDAYYTDSPSTEYWATTFYKVTESARREKLWKPKAQLVKNLVQKFAKDNAIEYIVDIGGGYGVFDEEIKNIMDIKAIVIEPSVHLAQIAREKGLVVVEKFMEDILPGDLPEGGKCYVSFELFEHLHEPSVFLQTVFDNMHKDDLFIFTTLSSMGVDIQVLRENSKSVSPPHHLNFMNPKSISVLLGNTGFEVLEVSTPGKLDIDILKSNQRFIKDPFWINLFKYASEAELGNMQDFFAKEGLSSHMMVTCRKP